uniref:Uncharacterized protein n=1 Tax=Ranid herpesvirus 4 TaxID=2849006 RepID=A0A8F3CIN1_9VIRU|nr:MAG: hypothetical protein [Ranid herpesvirus 4]
MFYLLILLPYLNTIRAQSCARIKYSPYSYLPESKIEPSMVDYKQRGPLNPWSIHLSTLKNTSNCALLGFTEHDTHAAVLMINAHNFKGVMINQGNDYSGALTDIIMKNLDRKYVFTTTNICSSMKPLQIHPFIIFKPEQNILYANTYHIPQSNNTYLALKGFTCTKGIPEPQKTCSIKSDSLPTTVRNVFFSKQYKCFTIIKEETKRLNVSFTILKPLGTPTLISIELTTVSGELDNITDIISTASTFMTTLPESTTFPFNNNFELDIDDQWFVPVEEPYTGYTTPSFKDTQHTTIKPVQPLTQTVQNEQTDLDNDYNIDDENTNVIFIEDIFKTIEEPKSKGHNILVLYNGLFIILTFYILLYAYPLY